MSGALTPEECLSYLQLFKGEDDFLQKHSGFFITVVGIASALLGGILTYFLKSRCTELKLGCISCRRKPLELDPEEIQISTTD